jgi:hypothetical protein
MKSSLKLVIVMCLYLANGFAQEVIFKVDDKILNKPYHIIPFNEHVLVLNRNGKVFLWDVKIGKTLWHFNYGDSTEIIIDKNITAMGLGAVPIAISANNVRYTFAFDNLKKHIYLQGFNKKAGCRVIDIIDAANGLLIKRISTKMTKNYLNFFTLTNNETSILLIDSLNFYNYEIASGKLIKEYKLPELEKSLYDNNSSLDGLLSANGEILCRHYIETIARTFKFKQKHFIECYDTKTGKRLNSFRVNLEEGEGFGDDETFSSFRIDNLDAYVLTEKRNLNSFLNHSESLSDLTRKKIYLEGKNLTPEGNQYLEKINKSIDSLDAIISSGNASYNVTARILKFNLLDGKKLDDFSFSISNSNNLAKIDFSEIASNGIIRCDKDVYKVNVSEKSIIKLSEQELNKGALAVKTSLEDIGIKTTEYGFDVVKISQNKVLGSNYNLTSSCKDVFSDPSARFDADESSMKSIFLRQGFTIIPLESFYEKLFTPELYKQTIEGKQLEPVELDIKQKVFPPPLVKIVSPKSGGTFETESLILEIEVTDQGGGIDEIKVFFNGKLVDNTQRGLKPVAENKSLTTKTFNLLLGNGVNKIKVIALNNQRTESAPAEITVNCKSNEVKKPNLYLLAIGINKYQNPKYSLNYAVNDANGFVAAIEKNAYRIFNEVIKTSIQDDKATKNNITLAINEIKQKAKPEDVFIFYYAGHGVMSLTSANEKAEFYIVPTDVVKMYDDNEGLKSKSISAKMIGDASKEIKAQKQLFVLDACQSGGAVETFAMRGAAEEKAIAQLARSTGTYFCAASGSEQFATEVTELGHGVFTYSLIKSLEGFCKPAEGGKVTVNLLKSCVEDMVPELTKKYKGEAQYPTGYGSGQDFPIGVIQK